MLRFLWTRVHGMSQLILNICVWFSTTLFEPKIQQKNTNWCVILIMNSNVSIVICFGWIPIAPKSTVSLLEYYFPSKWSDWRMNERFMMIWESTHTHTYTSRFILLKNFFAGADNVLNNSFCRFFSISFRCIEQTFKIEYENFFDLVFVLVLHDQSRMQHIHVDPNTRSQLQAMLILQGLMGTHAKMKIKWNE